MKLYQENQVVAILPAAGMGSRMKAQVNKVWLDLEGKSVVEHTLAVFQDSPLIDAIILVVQAGEQAAFQELLAKQAGSVPIYLTVGGKERQDSVVNGLNLLRSLDFAPDQTIVAIHDAARALITQELLEQVIAAAGEYSAVGVGVPVKDTIKQVNQDGWITGTPERSTLWAVQTPQVFKMDLLWHSYESVKGSGRTFSDDCGVVEAAGYPVKLVYGSYENIKITTPEDLILAGGILRRRTDANRAGL